VGQECSVEFFCVNILLLCVQGLCGPRKHTLCEFLCVAVDYLSCTASAWCRQMLSGVFLCEYFAVVCARFMWAQNAQWSFFV